MDSLYVSHQRYAPAILEALSLLIKSDNPKVT